jgi:hypothetical protein
MLVLAGPAACSGKTERGVSGEAPADKPAAGPAQVEPARPDPATQAATAPARKHLLMVVELEPAARVARTLTSRSVDLPLPRRRGRQRDEAWRAEVLSASGEVLFSVPVPDTSTVRAEFPDAQGKLTGRRIEQPVATLTLRLPLLKDAASVRVVKSDTPGPAAELGRVVYPQVSP